MSKVLGMKVTLKDIANKSGVSVSTVSRILSGDTSRKSSESTVALVRKTADELGYAESKERGLRKARRELRVGAVFLADHEMVTQEFFQGILSGIHEEAGMLSEKENLVLSLFTMTGENSQVEALDGAVVLGRGSSGMLSALRSRIPLLVYAGLNSIGGMDEVVSDCAEGIRDAVRHLYSRGCRRIAYIGPEKSEWAVNEHRYQGYVHAIAELGLENLHEFSHLTGEDGYDAAGRLLGRICPDGIAVGNDNTAAGVLKAILERGLRVPEDIKLTGFDNASFSRFMTPPLTTFDVPTAELGRFALKILMDRLGKDRDYDISVRIPYRLIERRSTEENNE